MKSVYLLCGLLIQSCYVSSAVKRKCIDGCSCYFPNYWTPFIYVDCSGLNLTKIPQDTLSEGSTLILRGNNISEISSEDFKNLDNIFGIDLRDNPIKHVPSKAFSELKELRSLYITAQSYHDFAFDSLRKLSTLRIEGPSGLTKIGVSLMRPLVEVLWNISITKTNIKTIDDYVFARMKNLRYVELSHNSLESLSIKAFEGSPAIYDLYLRDNKLKELPLLLKKFYSLEKLDVSSNFISTIDAKTIKYSTRLKELDASYNKIKDLDENCLAAQTTLYVLKMSHNQLSKIPRSFYENECFVDNQYLDLGFNNISKIDTSTWFSKTKCNSIKTLILASNPLVSAKIKRLGPYHYTMEKLDLSKNCKLKSLEVKHSVKWYDLSETCLSDISKHLNTFRDNYKMINNLNLYGNQIKKFHVDTFITNLNLSSNGLEEFSTDYWTEYGTYDLSHNKLKSLQIKRESFSIENLLLRDNLLKEIDMTKLINVNYLDLSDNQLETFDSSNSNRLYHINTYVKNTTLLLQNNKLRQIKKNTFAKFTYLHHLDLSNNDISNIEKDAFTQNKNLLTLKIPYNKLTTISTEFTSLTSLKSLDLSNNLIRAANMNTLKNLKNLQSVSFSQNKLKNVPNNFTNFAQTSNTQVSLDFSQNELECSCQLLITLNSNRNLHPIGTCSTDENKQRALTLNAMTLTGLESKCNLCPVNPCKSNGICSENKEKGFACQCTTGYSGRLCDVAASCLDPKTPCQNGGTCVLNKKKQEHMCNCPSHFNGNFCQLRTLKKAGMIGNEQNSSQKRTSNPVIAMLAVMLIVAVALLGVSVGRRYGYCIIRPLPAQLQLEMRELREE